ncbi:ABC transporter ATP-binding protein [Mycobacteroides abscessus subsp. abscessus]|uniref:ABC transporter ATP-binding protein/permease n=3 Tax=Mycobacteroides abscessus TaxID=36809 RepID=UPI0002587DF1|nr:ABC transporter ATP-binding protein/permease [Mycobacteroides abscessus]EIC67536.1 ABC transporter ATP-binding protein [Mycobacteroides abscessus M93]CPV55508.1 ABC transporter ATP-binding protein [Mycobacteroides abscessus]SHQ64593.1 ABC transporter ATP-binding protein [Mycobacteroides abscessus subsp. abscessus]SHR32860.1 ABC transporter ATP-binding protein [Mycobacteroides abscessus subsp. abscessus]SHZ30286.1 ABC transporter ATP-binding protein [Mycobacteroides abscessus subsp. abscessu
MLETSIDWGSEVSASALWIGRTWLITVIGFALVAVLLARYTVWGRQFWRITGDYFKARDSWRVWVLLAALLLCVVSAVRIDVLFTYQANDQMTALQRAFEGISGGNSTLLTAAKQLFWFALVLFAILATLHVIRVLVDAFLLQVLIIRWRLWLTDRVTNNWFDGRAYYRSRFIDDTIDNPDQRIQADINNFVSFSSNPDALQNTDQHLAFGAINSIISIVSFTLILWELSGPLALFGYEFPRAMVFLAFLYILVGTLVAFWIGRPLIRLYFLNERLNAVFRYTLVRLRDTAESIAFYRGENVEHQQLRNRIRAVIANFWRLVRRSLGFSGWNLSVTQAAEVFPVIIQAPRLFAGDLTLGQLLQTTGAFRNLQTNLSFFRNAYDNFAAYRATVNRLDGLLQANEQSRELPALDPGNQNEGITLENVYVRKPNGDNLIDDVNLELFAGDALVIKGSSGSGKTTLLRSLAQLWPYADGHWSRPGGENETMFISQLPYIPLGNLRDALTYPAESGTFSDDALREVLDKVSLSHVADRLSVEADWIKVLSPGEQQRVAFARILLIKPKVVFMDESTSALDEGLEFALYRLVRTEVPHCTVVSVSHRSTVDQHHTQKLELLGEGRWSLSPL